MKFILSLVTIFLIQFIITFESAAVYAISPFLSTYFSIQPSYIILINLGFALAGLFAPFFGIGADKYGKKRFIIYGVISIVIGNIITGFSKGVVLFIIGRTINGLGFYNLSGLVLAYLGDLISYKRRGMAVGVIRLSAGLAILCAPIFATFMITNFNLHYYYFTNASIAIIILFLTFFIPESKNEESVEVIHFNKIFTILKNDIVRKFLFIQFVLGSITVLIYGYFGIYLSEVFLATQEKVGFVYAISASGTVVGIIIAGILSDKIGKIKFTKIFIIVISIVIWFLPFVEIKYVVVFLFIFSAGFDAFWTVFQAISSEIITAERSTFMALLFLMVSLSLIIFYLIGPILFNFGGIIINVFICGILLVISTILYFMTIDRYKDKL